MKSQGRIRGRNTCLSTAGLLWCTMFPCAAPTGDRYARWKRTYKPGITFKGVGVHVIDNEISWAPHQGIGGKGNENLFEGNHLHDLCYETTDSGAFYVGQSWSQRGNIVRNNVIENVRKLQASDHGTPNIRGIYLDDQLSGWNITNNTFVNIMQGMPIRYAQRPIEDSRLCFAFSYPWPQRSWLPGGGITRWSITRSKTATQRSFWTTVVSRGRTRHAHQVG